VSQNAYYLSGDIELIRDLAGMNRSRMQNEITMRATKNLPTKEKSEKNNVSGIIMSYFRLREKRDLSIGDMKIPHPQRVRKNRIQRPRSIQSR